MTYGHALDEIHELMVKQNLTQLQMLVYPFVTSFSKAVVGYGIKLHGSGGDMYKNGSGMSRGRSIHCLCRRHVQSNEDKEAVAPITI